MTKPLIDYGDPEVVARQNIAPNAACDIDGEFYDVRNLVHRLRLSLASEAAALERAARVCEGDEERPKSLTGAQLRKLTAQEQFAHEQKRLAFMDADRIRALITPAQQSAFDAYVAEKVAAETRRCAEVARGVTLIVAPEAVSHREAAESIRSQVAAAIMEGRDDA